MSFSKKINKILLIVGLFLIVFIIGALIYYKSIRRIDEKKLEKIDPNDLVIEEYEKQVIGNTFDFVYINDAELLDEVDEIRFMYMDEKYYIIKNDEVLGCKYSSNNRYCYIDDKYSIDFKDKKIIKK